VHVLRRHGVPPIENRCGSDGKGARPGGKPHVFLSGTPISEIVAFLSAEEADARATTET